MKFRNLSTALLAACLTLSSAHAADYYVVIPVKGKKTSSGGPPPIDFNEFRMDLWLNGNMPAVTPGIPFEYNLRDALFAHGGDFDINQVEWTGTAPGLNLTVTPDGRLVGTPSASLDASQGYTVAATATFKEHVREDSATVYAEPLTMLLWDNALVTAYINEPYEYDINNRFYASDYGFATGKNRPTFSLGSIPHPGISLSSDGILRATAGVPEGNYSLPVTATYFGMSTSRTYVLTVTKNWRG